MYFRANKIKNSMENKHSKPFFQKKEEPVYTVGEGVSRQFIGYNNEIMMVKVIFDQGAEGFPHSHPHVQVSYIVSGKYEVTVGSETEILEPGDGFYVDPDVLHGLICLEAGEILDAFSPMRDDFYESIHAKNNK